MLSSQLLLSFSRRLRVAAAVTPTTFFLSSDKLVNHTPCYSPRCIQTSANSLGFFGPPQDEHLVKRIARKFGWTESSKSYLKASAYFMYIKVADDVNYKNFFSHCNLEDTFVSWFCVVELHLWMLAARIMHEGDEGRIVRNAMFTALWEDCEAKTKKLDGALASARKRQIKELGDQFQATMISYDEGIQGNDTVLAGALWRRFIRQNEIQLKNSRSPEEMLRDSLALEMLVIYTRSQCFNLNEISKLQVLKRKFEWSPFDKTLFNMADKMPGQSLRKYV